MSSVLDAHAGDDHSAGETRDGAISFPRASARTRRFTLGAPRDVVVSPDGARLAFLRSGAGDDPVNCLWVADVSTGDERLVADPAVLLDGDERLDDLPAAERARRERAREAAGGITAFATDAAVTVAAFALGGRLFVAGLISGRARELPVPGPVVDPRPDPPATRVAYVCEGALRIAELDGTSRTLIGDDEPETVGWGVAEFIAQEELGRSRGFWWSPDGTKIAVCRVDDAPVQRWHLADPAEPARSPNVLPYPAAGTDNADVTLHVVALDGSEPVDVEWDRERLPYLSDAGWSAAGLTVTVRSRDQHDLELRRVDPSTGFTECVLTDHDDVFLELVSGAPRLVDTGTSVTCVDRDGARRLVVGDEVVTPSDLQVRSVVHATAHRVVFTANPLEDASSLHVWRWDRDGGLTALTDEPGIHGAAVGGPTVVLRSATMDEPGTRYAFGDGHVLTSFAAEPPLRPNVTWLRTPDHGLTTAVLLPHDRDPDDRDADPLPVLVDPYGGPHAQRAIRAHDAHLGSQWFADQGFAVVVTDGRGTPGRGTAFERAVAGDLATAPLDDQVEGLLHAAARLGTLDLDRVAIRGWSFGGYLAALAVLRRPDVFHAAVAGAPVTEWRLYDTAYTERYLGHPDEHVDAYDASSLLPLAPQLRRPLLLIHGLADDNVVAAHTLRLSSALLAAGRPHEVLPLVGVTHMTPQEVVAENLLAHQLDFLRRALALPDATDSARETP